MTDIWHEPTETPTEHKTLLFDSIEFDETEMGVYSSGLFHSYNEFEPMTPAGLSRWAYLSDFINCQKELADTKKKLDIAVNALKKYTDASGNWWYGYEFQGHYEDYAGEYADKALDQINNIDKGE